LKTASNELRRTASFRLFDARDPATVKARSPIVECRVGGTFRPADDAERRAQTVTWFHARDWADDVLQINQYAQLVLDALRHLQPVTVRK